MTVIVTRVVGSHILVAEFKALSTGMQKKMDVAVRRNGQLLKTRVMANASGRPGPNTPTGDYRRSISLRVIRHGPMVIAQVGTNKPQGRRLEFGFHGMDSLGRHYNQPAYPHFGPAMDAIEPLFTHDMEEVLSLG